ncbi:MAG: hypothetical protein GX771_02230 [Halomonadaceae bacterium]|nr:hypothetical protein [Halomonadaceae bacterium]
MSQLCQPATPVQGAIIQALKFAFGFTATLTAIGLFQEEVWAKKALLMLGGLALIAFILKGIGLRRALKIEDRYRKVIESRVCPAWYLEEVRALAETGGFADELDQKLGALGENPSGLVVMNALRLCQKKAMQGDTPDPNGMGKARSPHQDGLPNGDSDG